MEGRGHRFKPLDAGSRLRGETQLDWWAYLSCQNLSRRALNILKRTNIDSDEFLAHTIKTGELRGLKGLGLATLEELKRYCGNKKLITGKTEPKNLGK